LHSRVMLEIISAVSWDVELMAEIRRP